jgi:DNA-binding response OmpR family regulator
LQYLELKYPQMPLLPMYWMLDQGITTASLDASAKAEIDRILRETITDAVGPEFMVPPSRNVATTQVARFAKDNASNPKTLFNGANRPANLDQVQSSLATLALEYMMQRNDQLLMGAMFFKEAWSYKFVPATNLVDVHMGRLRHKVDMPNEAPMINRVRDAGFILRAAS